MHWPFSKKAGLLGTSAFGPMSLWPNGAGDQMFSKHHEDRANCLLDVWIIPFRKSANFQTTRITEALHDQTTTFWRVLHNQVQKLHNKQAFSPACVTIKELIETMNDETILIRLNKIGKNPSLVSTRGNLESDCKQVLIFLCLFYICLDC